MCSFKKCIYTHTHILKMGWQYINRLQCGEALQYMNTYYCFICAPAQKLTCLFNNTCKVWQGYFCTIVLLPLEHNNVVLA